MKEKIQRWYDCGLWSPRMVEDAVTKGVLTGEEADEILGGEGV